MVSGYCLLQAGAGIPAAGTLRSHASLLCSSADRLGVMPPPASLVGLPSMTGRLTAPTTDTLDTVTSVTSSLAAGPGPSGSVAQVANLLPWLLPEMTPDPQGGIYVGEGLPPVPLKLAVRIRRHEFVKMAEILPEFWPVAKPEESELKKGPSRRVKQVTDFQRWLQCFATYCSILGRQEPGTIPELMAYLITIARVSQDFSGLAWVRYDSAFRRQAAITGNWKWFQINPSLYSICFTGRAQEVRRCELCLSTAHPAVQCPLQAETDPELPTRVKAVESAVLSLSQARPQGLGQPTRVTSEICRSWNANRCRFPRCKFRHACSACGEPHPVVASPRGPGLWEQQNTTPCGTSMAKQARREAPHPY